MVNKMVEEWVDNLLSKISVEIVVFRRKLDNLLLVIAVNSYNATCYVTSKHVQIK